MCVKVVVGMKYCPGCEANKSRSGFYKDCSRKDGLHGHCKECCRIYGQSEKGKDIQRRYYLANPEKVIAHTKVNSAIRDGKLERSVFCERCGLPADTRGHHEDYDKPLEVEWLCRKCHTELHRKEKTCA